MWLNVNQFEQRSMMLGNGSDRRVKKRNNKNHIKNVGGR